MEAIFGQIPGFIAGTLAGGVIMFFVYHNNKKLMDAAFDKAKAEFDEKEKALRAERDKLQLEDRIRDVLNKLKG